MQIIAEVKTYSPYGFTAALSWDELFDIANTIGDIIAIHTDPKWHGSFELLAKARKLTKKPILAKGIHADDSDIAKALDFGADLVLVVGRIPKVDLDKCLIEPLTISELSKLSPDVKAVWNSRDLSDGGRKFETFDQARGIFKGWLCQASNIKTMDDVYPSADAILVGSKLPQFAQALKTT